MITITCVEFRYFKGLERYSVALQHMNILVGPNNCGKSTIIGAFRALASGLKKARSKKPEMLQTPDGFRYAYSISENALPISTENVHTNYEEVDSWIIFRLSNRNRIKIWFPNDGGCYMIPEDDTHEISSVVAFKKYFPITVSSSPIIGPVEHEEQILQEETISADLGTHKASRHFRNFWYHYPDGFNDFAKMVKETWPGMEIQPPKKTSAFERKLVMWCLENRITREIYWSGYGFQIWCQLLTHIYRSGSDSILVIDEPEVYLHPDVQRQLLTILRELGPDIVIATHSTEIMAEADPSEILLIDKQNRSAKRLKEIKEVQKALEAVGSVQNITLTQLARNNKIIFTEGTDDFRIIRRFAKKLGYNELSLGNDITAVESGGFSSWENIKAFAWGFERTADIVPKIAAVFDRDYFCDEQIVAISNDMNNVIDLCHFHQRKEIENYLLEPIILQKATQKAVLEKAKRTNEEPPEIEDISIVLDELSQQFKAEVQGQYLSKRRKYIEKPGIDPATIDIETIKLFDMKWATITARLEIVPGKRMLHKIREFIQNKYGISLTDYKIIDAYSEDDIPIDIKLFCKSLEEYRTSNS